MSEWKKHIRCERICLRQDENEAFEKKKKKQQNKSVVLFSDNIGIPVLYFRMNLVTPENELYRLTPSKITKRNANSNALIMSEQTHFMFFPTLLSSSRKMSQLALYQLVFLYIKIQMRTGLLYQNWVMQKPCCCFICCDFVNLQGWWIKQMYLCNMYLNSTH